MQNDEEIADAVCDTAGQDSDQDEAEQTADAIKNKAKILEKKRLNKRLLKQENNCRFRDKIKGGEAFVTFESSEVRMRKVIEDMEEREKVTFWSEYVSDIKKACASKKI